jgi:hypothetical protein
MEFSGKIHPQQKGTASAPAGARDYRAWVGQSQRYDAAGAVDREMVAISPPRGVESTF